MRIDIIGDQAASSRPGGGALGRGLVLGSIAGVSIRAHFSLIFALPFFAWRCADCLRAAAAPGARVTLGSPLWAALLAVGLILAVVVHELGRVLGARLAGARVRRVTLVVLGAAPDCEGACSTAAQVLIALAGPAASALFALLFACAARSPLGVVPDVHVALACQARAHLLLAGVNLIPILPLDGGRLVSALLGPAVGRSVAPAVVAAASRVVAVALVALALLVGDLVMVALALLVWSRTFDVAAAREPANSVKLGAWSFLSGRARDWRWVVGGRWHVTSRRWWWRRWSSPADSSAARTTTSGRTPLTAAW